MRFSKADEDFLQAKGAAVLSEKVTPDNVWAWSGFQALRGSRGINGPIPLSEISTYCDMVGLADDMMRMRLTRFVMALDRAEREYVNTKT